MTLRCRCGRTVEEEGDVLPRGGSRPGGEGSRGSQRPGRLGGGRGGLAGFPRLGRRGSRVGQERPRGGRGRGARGFRAARAARRGSCRAPFLIRTSSAPPCSPRTAGGPGG